MIIIKYYYYDQYFAIPQGGNFYTKGELIDRYVIQSESYPLNSYYQGYWWIRYSFAYEEKYYLVTFKDWDGTIIDSSYILSGLHAIAPPNPDRYGYLFTGWSGNYTSVTSDRTITAVYESQTMSYEIMFLHESTLLYYTDVEHFGSVNAPAPPNVPGYTFSHWDGGDPSNWSGNTYHNVTSAIDFYTVYTKNSVYFSVTYRGMNNAYISSESVLSGQNGSPPTPPNVTGYTFSHWEGSYTNVTSDRTIYARYTIITYRVYFYNWDNTSLGYWVTDHGSSATLPATPTRPGYTFSHWEGNYTNVTSYENVYAVFTKDPIYYWVWFIDKNGNNITTQHIEEGYNATPPTPPSFAGYTFNYWQGSYTNITSDRNIYAMYSRDPVYYSVYFYDWNGSYIHSVNVIENGNASPPTNPTRANYDFTGWSGSYTNVTSNRDLYAQYTLKVYTVVFYDWDGTWLWHVQVSHGSSVALPTSPTRTGYTFSHWEGNYTNVTSDANVIAKYTKDPIYYSVTYINIQGYDIVTRTIEEGHDDVPPTPPLVEGYDFSHWEGSYTNVTSNRTIYARYAIKVYTVTFYDWDWTRLKREWISHGSSATAPPNPSRVDHNFSGWSDSYTEVTSDMNIVAYYTFIERTLVYQKVNGVWVAADKTYMKVNNVWKEIADILLKKGAYWISSKNS